MILAFFAEAEAALAGGCLALRLDAELATELELLELVELDALFAEFEEVSLSASEVSDLEPTFSLVELEID